MLIVSALRNRSGSSSRLTVAPPPRLKKVQQKMSCFRYLASGYGARSWAKKLSVRAFSEATTRACHESFFDNSYRVLVTTLRHPNDAGCRSTLLEALQQCVDCPLHNGLRLTRNKLASPGGEPWNVHHPISRSVSILRTQPKGPDEVALTTTCVRGRLHAYCSLTIPLASEWMVSQSAAETQPSEQPQRQGRRYCTWRTVYRAPPLLKRHCEGSEPVVSCLHHMSITNCAITCGKK
jgi:hypothetical protein